jgi:hypothetical protein
MIDQHGSRVTDPAACSSILNEYFGSVFTVEDLHDFPDCPKKTDQMVSSVLFTPAHVLAVIRKTRNDAAPGIDGVTNLMLKNCEDLISPHLCFLFQAIMDERSFPSEWRQALVIPIHKKGPLDQPKNFRPISLTSVICKVCESIVRDVLVEHVIENSLFAPSQYGFVKGKSCVLQLLDSINFVTEAINAGDAVDMVFMDFAKAFDKVPHRRLLLKLRAYGVTGNVLSFVESFLSGRTQRVLLHGKTSESVEVTSGVPQGSVLGPLLFLFYIDDIDRSVGCRIWKFADDCKLAQRIPRSMPNPAIQCLQRSLDGATQWVKTWESVFNVDKFVCLHFGSSNPGHKYSIGGTDIPVFSEYKDLGVWMSSDLKSSFHCREVCSVALKTLHLIRRSLKFSDVRTFMMLYKSLVRPRLEYASSAWNPHYVRDVELIEKVQRLATRLTPGMRQVRPYEERLRILKLQKLETRRARADLILLYQMCHKRVDFDVMSLFDPAPDNRLRGHNFKLRVKLTPRCDARRFFFANRVVEMWNSLGTEVVNAPTVEAFKRLLHRSGGIPSI